MKAVGSNLDDLIEVIQRVEADARHLDLEAGIYLHGAINEACSLNNPGFYQECIKSVIINHQPSWIVLMKQGRRRFISTLKKEDQDIFHAAGLMDNPPSVETVFWWDDIVGRSRLLTDLEKMKQAREAEQLSFIYEIEKLAQAGIETLPVWQGLDDNFAGYDILSYERDGDDVCSKLIEVKSTIASPLRFIITRNEWDTAIKTKKYIFHVWDMTKKPAILHIKTADDVRPHIPQDNEKGTWKTAQIPLGI